MEANFTHTCPLFQRIFRKFYVPDFTLESGLVTCPQRMISLPPETFSKSIINFTIPSLIKLSAPLKQYKLESPVVSLRGVVVKAVRADTAVPGSIPEVTRI